jgi:hypothetical protein
MKSSLAADLAAACLTGTPFLGFEVPEPLPGVAILTLETTPTRFAEMFDRACAARSVSSEDLIQRTFITNHRDLLWKRRERADLNHFLFRSRTTLSVLDPVYLWLPPTATTSVFEVGRKVKKLLDPVFAAESTPVLLHHFREIPPGRLPGLNDLSGAGLAEFARAWLLVNRERVYTDGGIHDLVAAHGTSLGDAGTMRIRFDEKAWKITTGPLTAKAGRPVPVVQACVPEYLRSTGA